MVVTDNTEILQAAAIIALPITIALLYIADAIRNYKFPRRRAYDYWDDEERNEPWPQNPYADHRALYPREEMTEEGDDE